MQKMVEDFDYDTTHDIGFCEACVATSESSDRQTHDLLELVHSDICGKISKRSIGGAEYFLTLTDDKTCYSWVYMLKSKDQAFDKFQEWKAQVEKAIVARNSKPFALTTKENMCPTSLRHI